MKKEILAIITVISANISAHAAEIYFGQRPPWSDAGIVYKGDFYHFDNSLGKCDLYLGGGCFVTTQLRATALENGIIKVGDDYYCSAEIIPDTSGRPGYTSRYGKCTPNGWIPSRDF